MRMNQSNLMAEVPGTLLDDEDDTSSCCNVGIRHWLETGKAPCTYGIVLPEASNSSNNTSKQTLRKTFFIKTNDADSVSDEILSILKRKPSPKEVAVHNTEPKKFKKAELNAFAPMSDNAIEKEKTSFSENMVKPVTEVTIQPKKTKTEVINALPKKSEPKTPKQKPKGALSPKKVDVSPIVNKKLVKSPKGRRKKRPFSPPINFSPSKFLQSELQSDRITRSKVPVLRSSLKQANSHQLSPEEPSPKPKKLSFMTPVEASLAFADIHTNGNEGCNNKVKTGNTSEKQQTSNDKPVRNKQNINNCKLTVGDNGSGVDSSDISGLTANYILSTRIEKSKTDSKLKAHEILSRSKNVKPLIANNVKTNCRKFEKIKSNDKLSSSEDDIFTMKHNNKKSSMKHNKSTKKTTPNKQVTIFENQEANQKPNLVSKGKSIHKKVASFLSDSDDEKKIKKKFFM